MESFYSRFELVTKNLLSRSQDILRERYGIVDGDAKTLEAIGKKYRITRERVRQIIRTSLKDINLKNKAIFKEVSALIENTIVMHSGVMTEAELLSVLGKGKQQESASLTFFFESLTGIVLIKDDVKVQRSFALKSFSLKEWSEFMKSLVAMLENEKEAVKKSTLYKKYIETNSSNITEETFFHYIAISKEVRQNAFGKFGLSHWNDVTPKGTREKAFLVLKTKKDPLHFRKIAELIDEYGLNKNESKKTHAQTVHNELIKDSRFILVGRGIYALSEWGYAHGTVKEVITLVLKKSDEPMKRLDIIEEVLKLRQVKKSTIVINLNTFFAKVGKDAYTLKS